MYEEGLFSTGKRAQKRSLPGMRIQWRKETGWTPVAVEKRLDISKKILPSMPLGHL